MIMTLDTMKEYPVLESIFKDDETFKKYIIQDIPFDRMDDVDKIIWDISKEYYKKTGMVPSKLVLEKETQDTTSKTLFLSNDIRLGLKSKIENIFNPQKTGTDLDYTLDHLDELIKIQQVKNTLLQDLNDLKDIHNLDKLCQKHHIEGLNRQYKRFKTFSLKDTESMIFDSNDSLINNDFFGRKEIMVISGEPAIGKSVLIYQLSCSWSLGKENLGLKPSKPLKVLILQDEDTPKTIQRIYKTIKTRIGDSGDGVRILFGNTKDYKELDTLLRENVKDFKPDILIINPLINYCNGDLLKNDDSRDFFDILKPIVNEYNIGCIVVHHTTKNGTGYYGSVVISSIPRCQIDLIWDDKQSHIAKFNVLKRITESGIHNDRIQWSDNGDLFWEVSQSNNDRILDYIDDEYTPMTKLIEDTGWTKSKVQRVLQKLVIDKKVEHGSSGYRKPQNRFIVNN